MAEAAAQPAAPPLAPPSAISLTPTRSTFAASRTALRALVLRDLVVLKKNFGEFVVRTLVQPFLLVFVFLYVFPTIGQGVGGGGGKAAESEFATVLVAGVVGISIMFQGIQAVAMVISTRSSASRARSRTACRRPARSGSSPSRRSSPAPTQGLIAALIVFPIAAVVHASGVEAHLHVHWAVVLTLIPLACVTMTSLGLLLGTVFEARNLGLMFGFVVLPLTFLGGTYYQWTKLAPVQVGGVHWLQILVLVNPLIYVTEGMRAGLTARRAHAPLHHLSRAHRILRDLPRARAAQVRFEGAVVM